MKLKVYLLNLKIKKEGVNRMNEEFFNKVIEAVVKVIGSFKDNH